MGSGVVFGLFIQEYEMMESMARERLTGVTIFDINSCMKRVVGRFDDTSLDNVFGKFLFRVDGGVKGIFLLFDVKGGYLMWIPEWLWITLSRGHLISYSRNGTLPFIAACFYSPYVLNKV
jgi:hypothetical protein